MPQLDLNTASDLQTVALFSIPGCVCFPHMQVPLHVFEPRYREMVNYCISNSAMMGVCHTQKVVHQAKENQSLKQALNSNQSTYKPQEIFSIGEVELLETLPDGRMHILVKMRERVKLERQVQTLPFTIAEVSGLPDAVDEDSTDETRILKEKIVRRMLALSAGNEELAAYLQSPAVSEISGEEFSNEVFSVVRLDPAVQQHILEMRSPEQRLKNLLNIINSM